MTLSISQAPTVLTGTITTVLAQGDQHWLKATLTLDDGSVVTASGKMPSAGPGARVRLIGTWNGQGEQRSFRWYPNSTLMQAADATADPKDAPLRILTGKVRTVHVQQKDTDFTVFTFEDRDTKQPVRAVGCYPNIKQGQDVKLHGRWEIHKKFGHQFTFTIAEPDIPLHSKDLPTLLKSGLVKNIGEKRADALYQHFGDALLNILNTATSEEVRPGVTKADEAVKLLCAAKGIGKKFAGQLIQTWQENLDMWPTLAALKAAGFGHTLAYRIYKHYGQHTKRQLLENPYQFARDVDGVGFDRADSAFKRGGQFNPLHPMRIEQGLLWMLEEGEKNGHTCLPLDVLLRDASLKLGVDIEHFHDPLALIERRNLIVRDTHPDHPHPYIYRKTFYDREFTAARRLISLISDETESLTIDLEEVLHHAEKTLGISFSQQQRRAVAIALTRRVMIVTGGPGTGKSTALLGLCMAFEEANLEVTLAAPTGRAAQRMMETTGREAKTIHRLLEYNPVSKRFERNAVTPLETNVLIIDESSMVDLWMFYHILEALPQDIRLILIGDKDQLPSVAPGAILRDLIKSQRVPVVELTHIFRQAQQSLIVTNAHNIRQGKSLVLVPLADPNPVDCRYVEINSPEQAQEELDRLLLEYLPSLGYDPIRDVQIVVPMHKGPLGTREVNQRLQRLLNPHGLVAHRWTVNHDGTAIVHEFRHRDRVIQVKNNYNLGIFNGDLGHVTGSTEESLDIQFQGPVQYPKDELNELQLAYGLTIHKSQGSEFPVVVLLMTTSHWPMLERNLFYTGLTRARKLAIIMSNGRALYRAIHTTTAQERHSLLKERLIGTQLM